MFSLLKHKIFAAVIFVLFTNTVSAAGIIDVPVTFRDAGTIGLNLTSSQRAFFNVKNTAGGNNPLTITAVTSNNSDFSIFQPTTFPQVIPSGGSYLVVVDFTPTSQGAAQATITITSDDSLGNTSINVTAVGYGGLEQSISLSPANIEIATGQGKVFRAEVTYDNGDKGPAQLTWTSTSASVASVTDDGLETGFTKEVSSGAVEALSLGTTTIRARGVNNTAVTSATSVTVVAPEPFEFIGASSDDRITKINESGFTLCYDFPETDNTDGSPLYSVGRIGVSTINVAEIDEIYVTADSSAGSSEQIFNLPNDCSTRNTVFTNNNEFAVFTDIVVDSLGRGIAANFSNSTLWQVDPAAAALPLLATGLPGNDIGKLAIDSADNVYAGSNIATSTERHSAVYVRPAGVEQWFPVAAVFDTLNDFSLGLPGIAAIKLDNQGYAMKVSGDWDQSIVEKYVDLNMDGNFYQIIGSTVIPDPGEIVEVAHITAGVDVAVDSNRDLIVSTAEKNGRNIMRLTDLNQDGDFDDAQEQRVIYQSNAFTKLVDIAFASPCNDLAPSAGIGFLPPSGVVDLNENIVLLGGGSSDPCNEALTYAWDTNGDGITDATGLTTTVSWGGLPDIHDVALTVTDPQGNTGSTVKGVKVGPAAISGFWPSTANAGDFIFIFGKNFKTADANHPNVCFSNGTDCTFFTQVVSSDMIITILPSGVTPGTITFTNPIATATSNSWGEVRPSGTFVDGIWPGEASPGDLVFVFGAGFSTTPGGMQVTLNGVQQYAIQPFATDLFIFIVPAGATSGPVCATVGGSTGCSNTDLTVTP